MKKLTRFRTGKRAKTCRALTSLVLALLLWFLSAPPLALAETKIRIAYTAISSYITPVWLASEAHVFAREGLAVDLIYVAGGPTAVQALLSGNVDYMAGAGNPVIEARLNGAETVIVMAFANRIGQSLMVRPDIPLPANLKGKRVGVTRLGSLTDVSARYIISRFGMKPDQDVSIIQIGGLPQILAALQSGAIHGGILSPPGLFQAKEMGYRELFAMPTSDLFYLTTAVGTTESFVKKQPQAHAATVRALAEGLRLLRREPELSKRVIQKYTKATDPRLLDLSYDYTVQLFDSVPLPSEKSIETILRFSNSPKARAAAHPGAFLDVGVVKELEKGGFFR